jgi:hypothetical protein
MFQNYACGVLGAARCLESAVASLAEALPSIPTLNGTTADAVHAEMDVTAAYRGMRSAVNCLVRYSTPRPTTAAGVDDCIAEASRPLARAISETISNVWPHIVQENGETDACQALGALIIEAVLRAVQSSFTAVDQGTNTNTNTITITNTNTNAEGVTNRTRQAQTVVETGNQAGSASTSTDAAAAAAAAAAAGVVHLTPAAAVLEAWLLRPMWTDRNVQR